MITYPRSNSNEISQASTQVLKAFAQDNDFSFTNTTTPLEQFKFAHEAPTLTLEGVSLKKN
ncbi:hypothetical protein [Isorropodon fossajaponicum symbiont]|uniref:hypothetical protein n=1 Tax=Isorropodon fossajaponicum symbiont TaxID=883811 RepID=UPI001915ED4E|nr:hypothetical protein [Isorropodon fossajaponicum symbiont]